MRLAYADPPYPGQSAKHYKDHPDYAGEVAHDALVARLQSEYDGWVLHTSSPALAEVLSYCDADLTGVRVGAWVKPFAAFKPNVPVAYAWEPIIFRPARKQQVGRLIKPLRDWVSENITMKRGLVGAKPEKVCWACFEWMGAEPDDELHDLFPGSGAVMRAWEAWRALLKTDARPEESTADLFDQGAEDKA